MVDLFYDTVHSVNAMDYTKEQLVAWANGNVDVDQWNKTFIECFTIVAVKDKVIVGFGNIDKTGYLDKLFVHKNYQHQGIATAICNEMEQSVDVNKIITHASITAKPFFIIRGYKVVKEQQVKRNGMLLTNYILEKEVTKI
jgi:putative acetyltransferase